MQYLWRNAMYHGRKELLKTFLCPSYSRSKPSNENLLKENQIKHKPVRQIKAASGKMIKYWNNYFKIASLKLSVRWIHILILLDKVWCPSFFFYYILWIRKLFSGINLFTSVFIFHWHIDLNSLSFGYEESFFYWQNFGAGTWCFIYPMSQKPFPDNSCILAPNPDPKKECTGDGPSLPSYQVLFSNL